MSEWYYSNSGNDRTGPISAEDLAALHGNGQIRPESLVWREGMGGWRPWKEMMGEIALAVPAMAASLAPRQAPTFATAGPDSPPEADGNPYSLGAPASASPYAAPKARLQETSNYVAGGRVVYAGFWKRAAASIIDSFVTSIITYAVQIPLMMVFGVGMAGLGSSDAAVGGVGIVMLLLIYVLSIAIPLTYFSWMHSSGNQATLGKMAVGIKVTRSDGQRISFWRAFGRYWAFVLITLFTLGIGLVVSAFTSALSQRKQALHDMICDTLVVDKWAYTDHPEWQREELGVVTIVILCLGALLILGMFLFFAMMGAMLAGSMN
jgi:uncharacterized RDD family membrane protein YckC